MNTTPTTTAKGYWSRFFGLSEERYAAPGVKVVPHHALRGYPGAWLFRCAESGVISVPTELVEEIADRAAGLAVAALLSDETPARLFGDRVAKTIGPAFQGVLAPEDFAETPSVGVRLATGDDAEMLRRLEREADPEEWSHSAIEITKSPLYICVVGKEVVAAACHDMWEAGVVNPGVITSGRHRGKGYAKAVLSAAIGEAHAKGLLVLYQTIVANQGAVGAAKAVGIREYAQSLAVRFQTTVSRT